METASLNVKTVWLVYSTNMDGQLVERVGACSTEGKAQLVAQNLGGRGPGDSGKVVSAKAIVHQTRPGSNTVYAYILDGEPAKLDEHVDAKTEEVRERALKKLSAAERVALGLPDPKPPVEVYDRT
jgi:hypothetical protein